MLLDVILPGLDGFTTCERVRQMAMGLHLPIVMMTGLDDDRSIQRAYEAGATDFITKPILWPMLTQRLRYILRTSAALRELAWRTQFQRVLMDTLPVPVVVEDSQGRPLLHNQAFADLLNCRHSECLADPALQARNGQSLIPLGSDLPFGLAGQRAYPAEISRVHREPREVIIHQAVFTPPDADETSVISAILD